MTSTSINNLLKTAFPKFEWRGYIGLHKEPGIPLKIVYSPQVESEPTLSLYWDKMPIWRSNRYFLTGCIEDLKVAVIRGCRDYLPFERNLNLEFFIPRRLQGGVYHPMHSLGMASQLRLILRVKEDSQYTLSLRLAISKLDQVILYQVDIRGKEPILSSCRGLVRAYCCTLLRAIG